MKILLKKVLIADKHSIYNNKTKDIFIENDAIISIENNIEIDADSVFDKQNTVVGTGWIDIFSHFNDPGQEFKETLESGANAALAGGFTTVFVVPNTNPSINSKSQVEYIVQKSKALPVAIYPLGAVTKNIEGKDLAEMYDMFDAGAKGFSDGLNPVQSSGLFLKALQYVKAFDGTIVQMPIDKSIAAHGLVNEGIISTKMGLQSLPSIAEIMMIKRDIDLLRYTNSKLHITAVSTKEGIDLIANAKAEGLNITCSITPYHLFYCDEDLMDYNTNLKVNPPLRTKEDMLAIREAVKTGVIDCIATHHFPQNIDNKVCEFEYAKNGMIGLQTAFSVVNSVLPELSNETIGNLFSTNAGKIFGLPENKIEVGAKACLTLFSRNEEYVLTKENNKSKSVNSPFFNTKLRGIVCGIVTKNKLYLN